MSVHPSSNRFSLDALTVLRASGEATIAASAASDNYLTLDQLTSYWDVGANANEEEFAIEFVVESIGAASGTPTVTFSVQVDYSTAFAEAVTVASSATLTAAGKAIVVVTREQIYGALAALGVSTSVATPVYLRAYATIAGGATTPALGWNAFPAPIVG